MVDAFFRRVFATATVKKQKKLRKCRRKLLVPVEPIGNATENRVRRNLTASNSTQESLRGRFNLKTYGSQWKYKKTGQTQ